MHPVVIHHYDPVWPELYEREARRLAGLLGERLQAVAHVGSTAVPGLAARPVIDILAGVADLAADGPACEAALADAGWAPEPAGGAASPEGRRFYLPGSREDACHLHLAAAGGAFWDDQLLFRDYLRAHPRAALAYQQLKHVLLVRSHDRAAYREGKTGFVSSILAIARAERQGPN